MGRIKIINMADPTNNELTTKQKRFVMLYLRKLAGMPEWEEKTDAEIAIMAGYSEDSAASTASKLKNHNEKVKEELRDFREKMDWVIGDWAVAFRQKDILLKGNDRESIKAIQEYNKVKGNYAPKGVDVSINEKRKEIFDD